MLSPFVFLVLFISVFILLMNSQEVLCYLEIARQVGFYNGTYAFVAIEYNINPCKDHGVYLLFKLKFLAAFIAYVQA